MPQLRQHTQLYRNFDQQWERILSRPSSVRKLFVDWELEEVESGFTLTLIREDSFRVSKIFPCEHQVARTDQAEGIRNQLSRLGDTIYETRRVDIRFSQPWFVPHSLLSDWKREILLLLTPPSRDVSSLPPSSSSEIAVSDNSFLLNVSNHLSRQFYEVRGVGPIEPAMEVTPDSSPQSSTAVMFCRHCLRYSLGYCKRHGGQQSPYEEPFCLVSQDGRRFPLEFDCKNCQMIVHHA